MTITDSTITSNEVYFAGGGIDNGGTLTITSSTVSGNVPMANMMVSHGDRLAASQAR